MAQSKALLKVLNNDEEPLNKRIKIADNAFKSIELNIQHKEVLLLKWVVKNVTNLSYESVWSIINKWLSSEQFKYLTQNDITSDDISTIVKLFSQQLQDIKDKNVIQQTHIINGVLLLCDSKVVQQYFKHNLEIYCRFVSMTLEKIDSPNFFTQFLKNPSFISKNLLIEEGFHKLFLHVIMPILVKKVLEFENNQEAFLEVSKVVQKCLFIGNVQKFESFFTQCLEYQDDAEEPIDIPIALFKHLISTHNESTEITALSFKIIFHAFTQSHNQSHLIYKFLIVMVEMVQIDVCNDFNLKLPFKVHQEISVLTTVEVILAILDVLSTQNFSECEVLNISYTEFLRKLLKSLLFLQIKNSSMYEIILRCISINPLAIEPIASLILVYVMSANNENIKPVYERVVIAVFNVFAKLHRTENFIAKIIPALKSSIMGEKSEEFTNTYNFIGLNDISPGNEKITSDISAMFTENILQCFTNSINGLASWQVINVFKTLLFHLKTAVDVFAKQEKQDPTILPFLELLGTLISRLLQSIKIADYTIPQNVIEKLVKGLVELKDVLKELGSGILSREHSHINMRTFLNMSYVWGETYMTLSHYSINNEVEIAKVIDNTYTACNLRYLHSYLDVKQWLLISQRITNFGGQPCKKLLQKLYIQKLRAMLLFEEHFNNDIVTNIVKALQSRLEDTWRDLLLDKFAVNYILPKMDRVALTHLAEKLIDDEQLHEIHHIKDSVTVANALTYVVISKINKLFKQKRKHDEEFKRNFSAKIFALVPAEIFFATEDYDMSEVIGQMKTLLENREEAVHSGIESKEDKLLNYLKLLKKFPFIYSSVSIQESLLLYLFSLHGDILNCSEAVKKELEDLIIGTLQTCKYQLTDIFNIEVLSTQVLKHFHRYDVIFSLITDNVFKNESCMQEFEPLVNCLTKNLENSRYLSCSILVLHAVNKIKKSKMDSSSKETALRYKEKILSKIAKLVCKSKYLIEAYATCLKHYLDINKEPETLKKLLDKLAAYIQYSLENINSENKKGCVILFTAVLHNKQKITDLEEDIVLKIWNACKKVEVGEEYSHLVKLVITLIPNDKFHVLVEDLLTFTEKSISEKSYPLLASRLKTWESILNCDVNPAKMKVWQEVLEKLIQKLLDILKTCEYDEALFTNIVHLDESIIQTQRFMLSPPLIDMFIITVSILMRNQNIYFETKFNLSITILEKLLKYRYAMIMDRLPAFLQQYRIILNSLCALSNSDQSADSLDVKKASDFAHKLEKLTRNLVSCKKDMSRIAVFLIADILERYEQINLYPNVKLHLNNCIYSLISLCDHHAVSYLMRVLSSASTEMFKILYEHYKKYYMFTGKV